MNFIRRSYSSSVQSVWRVQLFATPWTVARQASLPITNSWSLQTSRSQWCHPTVSSPVIPFSSCLQSVPESVFSNESVLHIRWPKYWSFSFSISPSNEYSGLISFRMDWLYLLAVQGTFKSLLQHHSSKVSILQHSAFFIVQLLYPYMTTGKTTDCIVHGIANAGDLGLIPGLERSPGERKGYPLQYFDLENSIISHLLF